jgi:outer membrane protein insertion porin family
MLRRVLAALLCALAVFASGVSAQSLQLAQSFQPFTVRDIRVEGLQRTEPGTIFSYLPVKVGETMTEQLAQQALRALFATGFFQDVRLEVENGVLIVYVEERPAIAQIDFSGIKEFQPDLLRKVLREQGISEGRIFDRALLDAAEQEIKRQYLSRGRYAAEVQTTVTPLERNRVAINIAVTEGDAAKIRSINIVGAQAYRERDLLDLMTSRTPGWLTWYTKHDQYSRERLAADLESLRSFYQNSGYLDFAIDSTQVSITPDRKDIYVTINISEGERYTVSGVTLSGQLLLPREEIEKLIQLRQGQVFSRERLNATTAAITNRLGNEGYAFANANAVPQIDRDKRTVAYTLLIDPGRRVYVRRIEVSGNTRTRDEVIRREFRQLEGSFYDASKIQLSKRRVDRTGFFDDVNVETRPVPGSNDQVDVLYSVKEKSTGALLIGAGISSTERLVLSSSVSQSNVFGSGKYIAAAFNTGKVSQNYSLSYLNPYFTIDGISQGFDAYKRKVDASSLSVGPYTTDTLGGGLRFGYPISESDSVSMQVAAEDVTLGTFANSPATYLTFVSTFGNKYRYLSGTLGWARDTRDSVIFTNEGLVVRTSAELGQGDLQYYRLNAEVNWFKPLTRTYTLRLAASAGYGNGISNRPLPFFKNFYAGGTGTVRGYRPASLGPRDTNNDPIGGNKQITGTAEMLLPFPGADKDKSLRLGAFIDAGQVYGDTEKITFADLRYSAGVAVSWSSPFGPLRLSFAQPLNAKQGDQKQRIQFTFGAGF